MIIRRAIPEEAEALTELVYRSKGYWGYDEPFMEACREDLLISSDYIASALVYVGEEHGELIGIYGLRLEEIPMLRDFFIDPNFIGKGFGKRLWNHLLHTARKINISTFDLHSDPYAEEFYLRMGAKRIGEIQSTVFANRLLPHMQVEVPELPIIVQSELITIRATEKADLDFVMTTEQHTDNTRFISVWSKEQHEEAMQSYDKLHGIVEVAGEPVGYVILAGLTNPHDSIELTRITISTKGMGHGKETLGLLMKWVFEQRGAHRFWLDVKPFNTRAQHVYKQMGFTVEGILRDCIKTEETYESLIIMSILRTEYAIE